MVANFIFCWQLLSVICQDSSDNLSWKATSWSALLNCLILLRKSAVDCASALVAMLFKQNSGIWDNTDSQAYHTKKPKLEKKGQTATNGNRYWHIPPKICGTNNNEPLATWPAKPTIFGEVFSDSFISLFGWSIFWGHFWSRWSTHMNTPTIIVCIKANFKQAIAFIRLHMLEIEVKYWYFKIRFLLSSRGVRLSEINFHN